MFGAVQFGILAACIVLFVPMGMAGWQLSRNRMLFFSCALFITLSVGVHLTPYFSSFLSSHGSSSSPSSLTVASIDREHCISLLHEVEFLYDVSENNVTDDVSENNVTYDVSENNVTNYKGWDWLDYNKGVMGCEFQKLSRLDVSDLLNGSRVIIAGDSQARLVVVALLELLLGSDKVETVRDDLFKRHSDYHKTVDKIGLQLDFIWAPYANNLTNLLVDFREKRMFADVLVMGAGLWDMLHMNKATEYGVSLRMLKDSLIPLLPVTPDFSFDDSPVVVRAPHMFWLGMPKLINSKLNTEEKMEKMTDEIWYEYDEQLRKSKLIQGLGGPLLLLDFYFLTNRCGSPCTADGMHYNRVVYDASVHIMLNALLIKSQQKLS